MNAAVTQGIFEETISLFCTLPCTLGVIKTTREALSLLFPPLSLLPTIWEV